MARVRDAGIPLEVCITSNVQTRVAPSHAEHPVRRYFDEGLTVCLCTDNRLMSGVTLTREYEHAREVLVNALREVDGVLDDPGPIVLARGFGDGTTILQVRWWHEPDLRSQSRTLDRVVLAIRRSLNDAGIDLPSPEIRVTGGHHGRSG